MSSLALSRYNPFVFLARILAPDTSAAEDHTDSAPADRKTEMLCAFAELSMASHCIVGGPHDHYVHLVEALAAEHGKETA